MSKSLPDKRDESNKFDTRENSHCVKGGTGEEESSYFLAGA